MDISAGFDDDPPPSQGAGFTFEDDGGGTQPGFSQFEPLSQADDGTQPGQFTFEASQADDAPGAYAFEASQADGPPGGYAFNEESQLSQIDGPPGAGDAFAAADDDGVAGRGRRYLASGAGLGEWAPSPWGVLSDTRSQGSSID